ncbi:MAG: TIGR03663 family protein [Chloroflexi bacterium]|nr:TIGR03663 family protein [Chloroflexota bacterium]
MKNSDHIQKTESILDRRILGPVPITWEAALYVTIIAIALFTRFWDLGDRAFSHDEGIHANWSYTLFSRLDYKHNPTYHGPLLYHATALMFFLFGDSDYTAMLSPASFGLLLVGMPFFLRRFLGRAGALFTAFLIVISPSILYYSRALRHDIFALAGTMALVVCFFRFLDDRRRLWIYLGAGAFAIAFSSHELTYITGFILLTFLVMALMVELARKGARPLAEALLSIDVSTISACVVILLAIIVPLYTTLFTNMAGLATGTVGALSYWLSQHGVARGGQPWYYYLILVTLYEFLPLMLALLGTVYLLARGWRGASAPEEGHHLSPDTPLFPAFAVHWSLLSFVIYSWAGEKMPWLTIHIALPLIVLSGWFLNRVVRDVDWRALWDDGGGYLAALIPATILVLFGWTRTRPDLGGVPIARQAEALQWLAFTVLLAVLASAIAWYALRLGWERSLRITLLVGFFLITPLTFRAAWIASFRLGDSAREMIVYAQGTPDVPLAARQVDAISAKLVGDREMKVAYDDESSWPFVWYLRRYRNQQFLTGESLTKPTDAPVVIVGPNNEAKLKPFLANYTRFQYRLIWWPVQDYMSLTRENIVANLLDPATRQDAWNIFMFRQYSASTSSWPLVHNFAMYVRKDLVSALWLGTSVPLRHAPVAPEDQTSGKYQEPQVLLTFGAKGTADGQLNEPRNLALDRLGNVYVLDTMNHRVQKFDPSGKFLAGWGSRGNGDGEFNEPWGIAVDREGNVCVADTWNHRIQKFDPSGRFLAKWGTNVDTRGVAGGQPGGFYGPRAIAIDRDGNLLVTDTGNKRVQKFDPNGQFLAQYGSRGELEGQFSEPVGIAVDREDNVYVADTWNRRVQKFDPGFRFLAQWLVSGWAGESVLNKPYLAVDDAGNVYVTDPEAHRVLIYGPTGTLTAIWGGAGREPLLNVPIGISLDGRGNLYVADAFNHRVVVLAPAR